MGIRVHELAKELQRSSKEIIEQLTKLKVSVKGHMSSVEDDIAARLRQAFRPLDAPASGGVAVFLRE